MGIGISHWRLAREVSRAGQLGTVSGTGIWIVLTRRLQMGDPGGHVRRALEHFPAPNIAARILERYHIPGGKRPRAPFRTPPMLTHPVDPRLAELMAASSFVEVWLAREGHEGLVGINYLEKIQLSHLPSLYGAMLAGVDYVLMGAGIPLQIPEVLDRLAMHEPAAYRIQVDGTGPEDVYEERFDPLQIPLAGERRPLKRPRFLPIVSSHVLAQVLVKRSRGSIQGFVVEGPTAGGHNAPPRNRREVTDTGEPLYGAQDAPDLAKLRDLGLPFWLAGSHARPGSLREAWALGAQGIQAGSIFALSTDSGLSPELREQAISLALERSLPIRTNPTSSPSGYPFKEAALPGTLADPAIYHARERLCDIGALRTPYRRADGTLGYRCPAEPRGLYVGKGGGAEDTEGRRCLCNALCAAAGLPQTRRRTGFVEPPLLTLGTDLDFLPHMAAPGGYTARDAIAYLLNDPVPGAG